MKAMLRPLKGKYYHTEIDVKINDMMNIQIQFNGGSYFNDGSYNCDVSDRELEEDRITRDEWNKMNICEKDNTCIDMSGGHFEKQQIYELAKYIVDMINNQ